MKDGFLDADGISRDGRTPPIILQKPELGHWPQQRDDETEDEHSSPQVGAENKENPPNDKEDQAVTEIRVFDIH